MPFARSPRFLAFILCIGVLLGRGWLRLARARMWAEDGGLFFRDAITLGPAAILKPYAGYYHLIPRLIALAATPFPSLIAPHFYIAACLLITAACFSELASVRSAVLRLPAWLRVLSAVGLCFAPGMAEVWGNLANLHAVLFLWLALLAMRREATRLSRFERIAVLLAALTAGEAGVLVPVFAARAFLQRRPRSAGNSNRSFLINFNDQLFVTLALILAALVNFASRKLLPAQEQDPVAFKLMPLLQAYAYGFLEPLSGVKGPEKIWDASHVGYAALATALGLGLIALAILRGKRGRMIWLAVLSAMLIPLLTALVRAHAQASLMQGPSDVFSLARYAFQVAPFGFIAWLAALPQPRSRGSRLLGLALIANTAAFGCLTLRLSPLAGPRWRDELRDAWRQPLGPCATGADTIIMRTAPEGWIVRLPAAAICPTAAANR
jgi:hypothetical protein